MNLRNISANQLVVWAALLIGLAAAVMIGNAVGSSDMRFVAGAMAMIPAAVLFAKLKTDIWILIPIGWYLIGRLPWLPLPLTLRDLCFMAAIFSFALFFATRALPWRRKLGLLDYLIYINLAYLAVVYLRNPVGFWAMQTSMVGGRPYLEILLAFGAFIVLSRVDISDYLARALPLLMVIPTWFLGALEVVARALPQTAYPIAMAYSGVAAASSSLVSSVQQESGGFGETRLTGLQFAGSSSVLYLCSKFNPITLLSPMHPARVFLFALALAAIFLSGFRSVLLFAMAIFVLATILRRQVKDLWVASAGLFLLMAVLIGMQGAVLQLPLTMQRAMSWLPGDWDQNAVVDAQNSSRWRVEMWQWAWNDERILRDKIWGQGFGLSLDDMTLIANSNMAGEGGASRLGGSDREQFMITGTFHSGPLSTIKYIGIVGFCLYYFLMCYMAVAAWKLCRRAYGTKAFTLALFVGMPIIYEPFNFVVVFGGLDSNYSQMLFWAGLLNLTQRYADRFVSPANTAEPLPISQPNLSEREMEPVLARRVV